MNGLLVMKNLLEQLEKEESALLDKIHELNHEIDLYEEDYTVDLEEELKEAVNLLNLTSVKTESISDLLETNRFCNNIELNNKILELAIREKMLDNQDDSNSEDSLGQYILDSVELDKEIKLKTRTLITHKNCKDGVGCVLAAMAYNEQTEWDGFFEVIRVQYGDPVPNVKDKSVIIADFSYNRETLLKMKEDAYTLEVIDHHITAKDNLDGLDFCHFDMNNSGAVLLWTYLLDGYDIPPLLKYIEDRDLWKWELPNSKEVSAALQLISDTDYDECMKHLYDVTSLIDNGSIVLKYQQQTIDKIVSRRQTLPLVDIAGTTMPMLNTTTLISEIGNALCKYYSCACMYFDVLENGKAKRVFSLRGDGSIDVEKIAKAYGGGGHHDAAGFSLDMSDLIFDELYVKNRLLFTPTLVVSPNNN